MKKIIFMRHAKAEKDGVLDFDRVLSKQGEKDAKLMGKIIYSLEHVPDIVISSPAARAAASAEIAIKEMSYPGDVAKIENLYPGSVGEIKKAVLSLDDRFETILIIGHNPSIEDAVQTFAGSSKRLFSMTPAAAVCIKYPNIDSWKEIEDESEAQIAWHLSPKILRTINI